MQLRDLRGRADKTTQTFQRYFELSSTVSLIPSFFIISFFRGFLFYLAFNLLLFLAFLIVFFIALFLSPSIFLILLSYTSFLSNSLVLLLDSILYRHSSKFIDIIR